MPPACSTWWLSALLYALVQSSSPRPSANWASAIFTGLEKLIFVAVLIGAAIAAYGLYDGFLSLSARKNYLRWQCWLKTASKCSFYNA